MPLDRTVLVERVLFLRKIPIVGSLSAAELGLVAEYMRERRLSRGTHLFRPGDPAAANYYVVRGRVRYLRDGRLLGRVGPGAGLGGLAVLAGSDDRGEAVAETDTVVLELSAESIREIFEDHFAIFHHVLREMSRALLDLLVKRPQWVVRLPPAPPPFPTPARELDLVERILFLRRVAPFTRASINALAELSRGLYEVRFDSGTRLWEPGDPAKWVFLVVEGRVRGAHPSGFEFSFGPSEAVGVLEAAAEAPRWYGAVAEGPVTALSGEIEGLLDVLEDNTDMGLDYLAVVARWFTSILESQDYPLTQVFRFDMAGASRAG
jgi:CRP-like cAMP-binding protein